MGCSCLFSIVLKAKKKCLKRLLLILILICAANPVYSQGEASNWYFGFGAGIQFDQGSGNLTVLDNGQLFTNEGCASISTNDGQLLFYTDGSTVYNRMHQVMLDGFGLYGDASSTQSAIIVPKPNDINIYYIFTVDNSLTNGNFGLNYSEVDMTLDGGLGGVTIKNINLLALCSEKISAVLKDCADNSVWVLTFASEDGTSNVFNTYHAFEVNDTGIVTTSVKSTFPLSISDIRGYLKLSPDGTKMASANMDGIFQTGLQDDVVYLYDFDSSTGVVSNQQELVINTPSPSAYGVEFSPSNRFLYVHSSNNAPAQGNNPQDHLSTLTQFDLQAADIQASEFTVDQRQLYRGGLQLGPDGKIYRALSSTYTNGIPFLGVINNPNELGAACNYEHQAVDLFPNTSSQGLPPFDQALFNLEIDIIQNGVSTTNLDLCTGENYTLIGEDIPGATYTWIQDGVVLSENDNDLVVSTTGHFELFIDPNNGDCAIEGQAFVSVYDVPIANPANDINICDTDNDGVFSFDFVDTTSEIMGTQDPDIFIVRYYLTQADADAGGPNELILPYLNSNSSEQVFARIENKNYGECYDTASFNIAVFDSAVANNPGDLEACDDNNDGDDTNGQSTTDLGQLVDLVLNGQDAATFNVSFHSSQADADTGASALPLSFYNTVPDQQTIYIRIENVNYTGCFDTTSIELIVNRVPEAFDSALYQCDEDGNPDGFTLFNLTEAHGELSGGFPDRITKFYPSLADAENDTNEIDGNSYSNVVNPEIVFVRVINSNTGCYRISQLFLDVTATDSSDTILTLCDDDGTEDGYQTFTLSNASASITANIPETVLLKYYDSYEDALLEVNELPDAYVNTNPYNQTLYVRVENDNACYGISELQLVVYELPDIEIEEERIYCLNFYPETITLGSGLLSGSVSDYTYNWSTGEMTDEIEVNEPGTYTVTVTNINGCSKLRTITVLPSNIATFESIDVVDATSNNSITINVSGEGDYEFALDDVNGPYQDSNFFDNVSPGLHTVYVRDRNSCGIVEKIVSVIGFPKFFTPNGDSYHDYWQVLGVSRDFQSGSIIYIFDRYGKLLKQLSPSGPGWDGTFNGQQMPTSDYWFVVTLQDGRVFSSHFTLKR
ncbi:MAG: T9SS type B sorting domain-containing protein [Flavobacteriaceae bacterium]|nr:T9SS type B sorting domain-containing protein [Flavobacteriaceae bacterium]